MAVAAVLALMTLAVLAGCKSESPEPTVAPKVTPPVIAEAGVLKAGIDLSYPPFGGTAKGNDAGLDVDVASALAERLGLRLEIVDMKASEVASGLAEKRIDVGLAGLPITDAVLTRVTVAGGYAVDGPVFFGTKAETVTLSTLGKRRVAVQRDSAAYWKLVDELGPDRFSVFPRLRDAFKAVEEKKANLVAGDAIVGMYIARDFDETAFRVVGQLESAVPIGVTVSKDAPELETAVRETLDAMASDGVLQTLRSKWTTGVPDLEVRAAE